MATRRPDWRRRPNWLGTHARLQVPASILSGVPTSQLEAILAHELAHVRRHDFLVNLLQTLVETVFFYHPAVWWLSHRIRVERENCCDDLAVAALGSRVEYGRALLALEELRGTTTALALGVRSGSLLDRVRRLFGRDPAERSLGAGVFVGFGLLALALIAAGVWSSTQADDGAALNSSCWAFRISPPRNNPGGRLRGAHFRLTLSRVSGSTRKPMYTTTENIGNWH